jgi:DNA-binding NarL/FixJ family response regulator
MIKRRENLSMEDKNATMQDTFAKLTERNKEIIMLMAKGMKLAQETLEQSEKTPKQKAKKLKREVC